MKVFYITYLLNVRKSGVIHKITNLLKAFEEQAYDPTWVIISEHIQESDVKELYSHIHLIQASQLTYSKKLILYLSEAKQQDVFFFRYPTASRELNKVCTAIPNRIIFEQNSIVSKELFLKLKSFDWRDYLYMLRTRQFIDWRTSINILFRELIWYKKVLRKSAGVISVTSEIGKFYAQKVPRLKKYTVGNGIDTKVVNEYYLPKFDNQHLHALMICSHPNPWHGTDRLVRGLLNYSGDKQIKLHLVGNFDALTNRLAKQVTNPHEVIFYGFLSREEIDVVKNKCHVSIGSLALHRIPLKQGSVLKVREYLSSGMPTVIGYEDEDIANSPLKKYVYQIPANDSPVNFNKLFTFASEIFQQKKFVAEIREQARQRFDTSNKVKAYIEGFKEILL